MFKVNNRNTRTMCEICSKLAIKTSERRQCVEHVQSKHKRHQNDANGVVLVSLMLTLNIFRTLFWCFYCQLWVGKCRLGLFVFAKWQNVLSAFPFPEFESVQTMKLVSSKITFVILFLTIHNYFLFFFWSIWIIHLRPLWAAL